MIPEFARQVETIARRLRRRLMLRALSWIMLAMVSVSFSLGGLDYFLRFHERGLRFLATGTLIATMLWCFFRIARPVLAISIDKVALAHWLEKFQQGTSVSLAAAYDLLCLPQDDVRWGSRELRHMAIEEAERHWKVPHWQEVQTRSIGLWPGYLAACLLIVIIAFVLTYPVVAGTAIIRLLNPWSNLAYPQKTHLVVTYYPERLSRGDAFVLRVGEESGQLPSDVRVLVRHLDGETHTTTSQPMKKVGHQFLFRQENVRTTFEFQVIGGDDRSQPWRHVEVVDPPVVRAIQVKLYPPSYTGWPPEDTQGVIRALCGSEARLFGQANRALKRVLVDCGEQGNFEAEVLPDRYSFRFPKGGQSQPQQERWIIQHSGYYRIRLEGLDGTFSVNEPRWEICAIEDSLPIVVLESRQRLLQITHTGKFPLRIAARDDVAINNVLLICVDTDGNFLAQPIPIFKGPQFPRFSVPMSELETHSDSMENDYLFQLPSRAGKIGDTIRLSARVEDYKGQMSESQPLEIRVVSLDELNDRLTAEEEKLFDQLAELYEFSRNIHRDWDQLSTSLRAEKRLSRAQANQLLTLDTMQRQAFRRVVDPNSGILPTLKDLASTAENNGMNREKVERLRTLHGQLETHWKQHGIPAESHLGLIANWARNLVERLSSDEQKIAIEKEWNDVAHSADELSSHQLAWETFLESLLQNVSGVQLANSLRRKLERILEQQMEIARQSRELGQQTLGRALQQLTATALNDLRQISRNQRQLATTVEELIGQTLEELERGEHPHSFDSSPQQREISSGQSQRDLPTPSNDAGVGEGQAGGEDSGGRTDAAARTKSHLIKLVIDRINTEGLSALMRQASTAIEQNRLSEAVTLQEQCEAILRDLIKLLQGKERRSEPAPQALARFERELRTLVRNQEKANQDFADRYQTGKIDEAFAEFVQQESQIREKTEKLLDDVSSVTQADWRAYLEQALQAIQAAQAGAQQKSAAATSQNAERAQSLMEQALDRLQQEQRSYQQQRAVERWRSVLEQIHELTGIQRDLLRRTQSLDIERQKSASVKNSQSWKDSVLAVRQSQDTVGQRISQMVNDLQDAPVISSVLAQIQEFSSKATQYLSAFECGKATQAAQQAVLRDLQNVSAAIQGESQSSPQVPADQTGDTGNGGEQATQPEQIFLAAQVKLLRDLQERINRRTENLEQSRTRIGTDQASLDKEYHELSREQAMVLELVVKLHDHLVQSAMQEKSEPGGPQSQPMDATSPHDKQPSSQRPWQPGSVDDLFSPQ